MIYTQEAHLVASEFGSQIVPHTRFNSVLKSIESAVDIGSFAGIFAGVRVSAPSGSGKTVLLEHVGNKLNAVYGGNGNIAMISASLKENPSVSQVQSDLIENFNYPARSVSRAGSNNDVNGVLVRALRQHRVRLIAIDEFQHVFLTSGLKVATPVIDWLKRLMNQTHVPVVLLGTESIDRLEGVDPQLTTRIPTVGRMGYFPLNGEWYGFVKALAGACKGMDMSALCKDVSLAASLHGATMGSPRLTKGLLVHSICIGLSNGKKTLDRSILKEAYLVQHGGEPNSENPFADA